VQKASNGKSLGNVRDSHTSKAVGKVIKLLFDDAAKAIRVGVKVVDNEAWKKVIEGVFTGFSIGGMYGKRWPDDLNKNYIRYEAIPNEISLVDLPCIPDAVIQMIKADGTKTILSKKEVNMKEKILITLKKQLGDLIEEELSAIADKLAAIIEENDDSEENEASEETQDNSKNELSQESAEDQPKWVTEDEVKEIVFSILQELGLVEKINNHLTLSTKVINMAKSEIGDLRKTLNTVTKDVAKLAMIIEDLEKRGGSGPVLREIGSLTPQASAALQKAEVLKAELARTTDPLIRQTLQNEIVRLEIQAVHQSGK
jgi:hypothetical protein